MKKIYIILALAFLFSLSFMSAGGFAKVSNQYNITEPCFNNGTYCSSAALCNITISDPDSNVIVNNEGMTRQGAYYNFTLNTSQTSDIGVYNYAVTCCDVGNCAAATLKFEVNGAGRELTQAESTMYTILLVIGMIIFGLCLYGFAKVPWKNQRDEEGFILLVNHKKYLKIIFFFFAYLSLLYLSSIASDISQSYITLQGMVGFFHIIYVFLLVTIIPMFWTLLIIGVITHITDKKLIKAIERGFDVR